MATATPRLKFDTEPCARCAGQGIITAYRHVAGGICAKCSGTKVQPSRKGRAAERAYEKALSDRLGRRRDAIRPGDVVFNREGTRHYRVDEVISIPEATPSGQAYTCVRFVTHREGGPGWTDGRGNWIVRLHDPQAQAEIAADIAARYAGATLA